uniref:Signal recognition particle subunit SRP54 n=1 Tax=Lygus hesperus TaxID=30085 RepID=A0A0A9X8R2_LYGHE
MQQVAYSVHPNEIILVMDGSIGKSAKEQAEAFHNAVSIGSIILTKLDGHAKGGGALSAVATTGSPILFIGTGEHVSDFEVFNPRSFASRLLGMGDISGLVSMLEETDVKQTNEKLMMKAMEGKKITIRDISNSMQYLMSLGSLSTILNMLPNTGLQLNKDDEKNSIQACKRCVTVIDSMTNKELDSTVQIFLKQPSRIQRVARGSGISSAAVTELLHFMLSISSLLERLGGKGGKTMMNALRGLTTPGAGDASLGNINFGSLLQNVGSMLSGAGGDKGNPFAAMLPGMMGAGGMPNMQALRNMQRVVKGHGKAKSPLQAMSSLLGDFKK